MQRVKTFDGTGVAPNGELFPEDLNDIQDAAAGQSDFTQTIQAGVVEVGEAGIALERYAAGEARLTGKLRTDGDLRTGGDLILGDGSVIASAPDVDMGLLIALS